MEFVLGLLLGFVLLGIPLFFVIKRMMAMTNYIEELQTDVESKNITMKSFSVLMFDLMQSEAVFIKYEPKFIDLFKMYAFYFKDDFDKFDKEHKAMMIRHLTSMAESNPVLTMKGN